MRFHKNADDPNDPFVKIQVYVPRSVHKILKEKSDEMKLPISRICAIAIDNELDSPAPFTYPCVLPKSDYIPQAYIGEAGKISRFLLKFPYGIGRDGLMLLRRDIGIPNREQLMLGYRELLEIDYIEEIKQPLRSKFNYGPDYLYTKLVDVEIPKISRNKARKLRDSKTKMILDAEAEREMKKEVDDNA